MSRAVDKETIELIKKEAEKKGWEALRVRSLTNHPDDYYLAVVHRYNKSKDEHMVHIFNSTIPEFYEGKYFEDNLKAVDYFWAKD